MLAVSHALQSFTDIFSNTDAGRIGMEYWFGGAAPFPFRSKLNGVYLVDLES